jgi:hypothetical protein
MLTQEFDVEVGVEHMAKQIIVKMELIVGMHKAIIGMLRRHNKRKRRPMHCGKGYMCFQVFVIGKDMAKMKKLGKKKALEAS